MIERIADIQGILRCFVGSVIKPGDTVLDATAGRGRDTLFLAQCVGETGRVYACDIQAAALEQTQVLLDDHHLSDRVVLLELDHARIGEKIKEPLRAAMFNLGYLPGGDRRIVTHGQSTVAALANSLNMLERGGIVTVTLYRGHTGAQEEEAAVCSFLRSLSPRQYAVLTGIYPNLGPNTPYWAVVQKNGGGQTDEGKTPDQNPRAHR